MTQQNNTHYKQLYKSIDSYLKIKAKLEEVEKEISNIMHDDVLDPALKQIIFKSLNDKLEAHN
jgi:hypothetical protein